MGFAALQGFDVPEASACQPKPCGGGGSALLRDAVVPADLAGLAIDPLTPNLGQQPHPFSDTDFHLLGDDGHRVGLSMQAMHGDGHHRKMRFSEALRPGVRYQYFETDLCGENIGTSRSDRSFSVSASVAPQSANFQLSASPPRVQAAYMYHGPSCDELVENPATQLEIQLPGEWEPWRRALKTDLYVDGVYFESFPRNLSRLLARSNHPLLLYARCNGMLQGGIAPGRHLVRAEVSLAGYRTVYSATVSIDLDCALLTPSPDAGTSDVPPVTADASPASEDAASPDALPATHDAAPAASAPDAGRVASTGGQGSNTGSGCTCAQTTDLSGAAPWVAFVLFPAVAWRRRRTSRH